VCSSDLVLPLTYEQITRNLGGQRSIKDWLHYHLIVLKQ
jgi:hypothetical protein